MAEFVCKVADAGGRVFQHVETASNEQEARSRLSERGLYVYWVRPRRALGLPGIRSRSRLVRGTDFLIFNQQFNTLIRAGLPILRALDLLAERAGSHRLRPVLRDLRDRVRGGALLSEAVAAEGIFPPVYVTCILAGEKSGNLPSVLDQYIAYQRLITSTRRRLVGVLVYPAILVTVATGILTYLVTYVIPQFAGLYRDLGVPLPGPTALLITLVMGLKAYIVVLAALLVGLVVGLLAWSQTERGGRVLDRWKLRLPVLGPLWVKFQTAQFFRTLAILLTGGTPLVPALETAAGSMSSPLVAGMVREAAQSVREGRSLASSLAAGGLMPELAIEMIEVGEASGSLAGMLSSVAEFFEEEVNSRLATLIAAVEPIILVTMAVVIAFILIALYLPLFSFTVGNLGG